MTDDELELAILGAHIERYEAVVTARNNGEDVPGGKCAYELNMREVIRAITGAQSPELDRLRDRWFDQLTGQMPQHGKPLNCCSDSNVNRGPHRWHAKAYAGDLLGKHARVAWERVRDLRRMMGNVVPRPLRELDQQFKILLAPNQAKPDFEKLVAECERHGLPISLLFLDIDDFKSLNTRHTEAVVDRTILPKVMQWLKNRSMYRGDVYRHGRGDEFLVLLPNTDRDDARRFAEEIRTKLEGTPFEVEDHEERITVSIGVAAWPRNGMSYQDVLESANAAKAVAKRSKNVVATA